MLLFVILFSQYNVYCCGWCKACVKIEAMTKILLVEFDPILAKGYEEVLANHFKGDVTVDGVATGILAIDCMKMAQTYDMVILEWDFPAIDGIGVSQKIRKLGFQGSIVAHTKFGMQETKKAILDGLINGFSVKDNEDNLLSVVRYTRRTK